MIKLSIVIPAYNAELYIDNTLSSMVKQNFEFDDVELLVINDGSTDNTVDIVNKFKFNNKKINISLIEKENGGLSSARNFGINHAQGEYIWFFDSDDIMEDNCLKFILDKLENEKLDLLSFGIRDIYKNHSVINNIKGKPTDVIVDRLIYLSKYEIEHSACVFIVRKEILIKNKLYFLNGVLSEDFDFVLRLYYFCYKISHLNMVCYNYYVREGSLSRRRNDMYYNFHHTSMIKIISNLNNFFDKNSEYYSVVFKYIARIKIIALINLINSTLSIKEKKKYYNEFVEVGILNINLPLKSAVSIKHKFILCLVNMKLFYPLIFFKSMK